MQALKHIRGPIWIVQGNSLQWVYTYTINAPTITLPADGGSTVACISDAQVVPSPATVNNSCGVPVIPTGPVVGPDPLCSGIKTYTWTYTDCSGSSSDWVYTYTITPPTFSLPADGSSTVSCISDAQVTPVPPNANNSCGDPLTFTGPVVGPDPVCSGTKIYTWTYMDCTGTTGDWVYTYTITPPTLSLPADGASIVPCISDAQAVPSPPSVSNSCGDPVTPTGPVIGPDPICSGPKTYTWTYTDCTGNAIQWVYTYTISPPSISLPAAGGSTVPCISDAQIIPSPPSVNNSCGDPAAPTGPVVGADPICSGPKTYTWTYTDCTGNPAQWVFTYTISPPSFMLPPDDGSNVTCVIDAQVVPVPPSVSTTCGDPITPTGPVISPDPVCSGTKTYTWTYADCTGSSAQWVYTYTIATPTVVLPPDDGSTVMCINDAQVVPTPPMVTNSCGDPVVPTGPVTGADPVCSGTKTYTWTYDDCSGGSALWVYTYTISPPTLTLPSDGGSTVACVSDANVVPTPPSVTNSCGDPVIPTGPVTGADPVCSGTKTYTWTYTDCDGTSADWVYTYTVSPPSFTLPADGGSTVACVSDAQVIPSPPTVNNSCGDPVTPSGPVSGADPVCSGTKTYTWTYVDCDGSSADWTYTYTVSPPTLSLPADGASTVPCISDAQVVPVPPVVNNSCGDLISPTGPVVGADPVCSGTKTYTWTYTDCTGSSIPWVYTYTISPPTLSLPADGGSTVPCISDAQTIPSPPSVNNSCGDPLTPTGPVVSADPVCSGIKTYTWTYTDCTGSSSMWVYTYTISPPTFSLPPDDGSNVPCVINAQVVPTPPVVNSSCGDLILPTGPVVGVDPVCSGTKTYTWTYTDCSGNSSVWVYTYTIDVSTIILPANGSSTVACISDAQTVPTPPSVINSCGDPVTPTGPVISPDPVCSGNKTYTWTYDDCAGGSVDWTYTYTISPPNFSLPANDGSTVGCIADAQSVPTAPIVNNSCGNLLVPTGPFAGADPGCSGTKTYTWTYTDCDGTTANWVYTYTITPPTFSLPADDGSTVACVSDAQVTPVSPVVLNSCSTPLTITGPVVSADPVCSGTKTYTWTYTDCTGTSAQWVYTYTITPPISSLPPDDGSTVSCISDAQVQPIPPVVNNSCSDPLVVTGPVVGVDPVCSGTKTYTWTYTDCTGNSAQWVYTYTITPPVFNLPADDGSTVGCISDAQIVPSPPIVNNSCGDLIVPTGPVVGADPVCSGTKAYTWTYMDCAGNSAQWIYTYTITPPTVTLPPNDGSTVACISDAQIVPTPPVVNNSCGDALTITGPVVDPDPACAGTKAYTWTYTDCSGGTAQWVYTYTINAPTISLPPDDGSMVTCVADAQVLPTPPSVNNSCGSPVTPTGPVISVDPVCAGTKTYIWTYTDCAGGSSQWTYTYTISASTFTLPADGGSTVNCVADAQVVPTPPDVLNSCGDPVTPTGPVIGVDPVCSGTKTYTWTYSDCAGGTSDWIYTYTISPNTGPVLSAPPADVTVSCIADVPNMTTLSFTDDCTPNGSVSGVDSAPVGSCPSVITRVWSITDNCGNSDSATQIITIHDTTPPTASDPAPVVVNGCNMPVPLPDITVVIDEADNCSPAPVVAFLNDVVSLVGCLETTVRNFSVTDGCGNSIVVSQTITRTVDTSPPIISGAPPDITVNCVSEIPAMPTLSYTDNCGPGGTIVGTETGPSGNPLTITRTWTITDNCGNGATVTQTITIIGQLIPLAVAAQFCSGSSVTVYGEIYNTPGVFLDTILSVTGGCDTALTVTITELNNSTNNIVSSFCQGQTYTLPDGSTTSTGGVFGPYMFVASNGCDSTVNVNLTLLNNTTGNVNYLGCIGDGYMVVVNGHTYDQTNQTGIEIIPNANGCDSTIMIDLVFNTTTSGAENYTGCSGDGYFVIVNGTLYNEANPTGTEHLMGSGGCDSIVDIDLQFLPNLMAHINPLGPLCTSAGVMTLTATPPGGIWSGEVSSNQLDPAALGVGSHQIIYTVTQGTCSDADTTQVIIYQLTFSCQAIAVESAPGANDGAGQITVSGGMPPYNLQWAGPVSGSHMVAADGTYPISGLPGGDYTVSISDASGCTATCQFTIITNAPCTLVIDGVNVQDATCSGVSNGIVTINASGGQMPYEYKLDAGSYQASNVFNLVTPGTHMVFVRDNTGCEKMQNIFVGVGPGPILSIVEIIDASCGVNNGSIEVQATLGSTPYTYSIDGITYVFSPLFPGLGPGNYLIYLIDNVGCTDTIPATVFATNAPVINNIVVMDASCGQPDGSITIDATGGQGTLLYSINCIDFNPFPVFSNLPAGNYTICVKDEADCPATGNANIMNIGGPTINNVATTPSGCGLSTGMITITATGNTALMYSIDCINYFPSPVFNNLPAGNYTVCVKDLNGCIASAPAGIPTTNGPHIIGIVATPTICGMDVGTITVNANGGTGALEYIFNGISNGNDNSLDNLPAGLYDIEVVDANACTAAGQATIDSSSGPDFDVYITPSHCGRADGQIELDGFNGMPPYTYSINGGPFTPVFTFVNRISNFYTVKIKDSKGCIHEEDVFLWEVEPPHISQVMVTNPGCGEMFGMIQVTATGSSHLVYSKTKPPDPYQDSSKFVLVAPGTYTITVKDLDGCTATSTAVIAQPPPSPVINDISITNSQCGTSSGSLNVTASGGVAPLMYSLNNGPFGTMNIFSSLPAGSYTVKVKGANTCEVSQDVTILTIGAQTSMISDAICDGDIYQIAGNTYTVAGNYTITIPNGATNGCDSVIQLTLGVNPLPMDTIHVNICDGEIYSMNGTDYSATGFYVLDTVQAITGCDTIRTLDLLVNPLETKTLDITICEGDIYPLNGTDYSIAGVYLIDTIPAITGCDTIRTLNLMVAPLETKYLDVQICTGGVFTIGGMDYDSTGEYLIDTIPAGTGCDSIRFLRLTVSDYNALTINASICEGDVYTINGTDFTIAGLYVVDTLLGPGGCDTIRSLNLTVDPLPQADAGIDQVLDCIVQSVVLNGVATGGNPHWIGPGINAGNQNLLMPSVSQPGEYILTVTSPQGCEAIDSVSVTADPGTVIANAGNDAFLSCDIDSIILQAGPLGPNLIYHWTGPDINAGNNHQINPVIKVAGTYTLVVTDTISGCVSLPDTVIITDITRNIVAIIQDPGILTCYSTILNVNTMGSSTGPNIEYIWFDEAGNIISTSPSLVVTSGGTFMFMVIDTISGCFDSLSILIKDLQMYPPIEAGDPQQLDCNTDTVTLNAGATYNLPNIIFHWEGPPGGILSNPDSLSILVGEAGQYKLFAKDTVNGCINPDSVLVSDMRQLPLADIQLVEQITCVDSTALINIGLSDSGPDIHYQWTGPQIGGVTATFIEPTQAGKYYLKVINAATGCESLDSIILDVPDLPVDVNVEITVPLCEGDASGSLLVTDVLGGTPAYMYSINGIPLQSSPLFQNLVAGTYSLVVVDANGCSVEKSFVIQDGQVLTIDIGPDIQIALGDSIQLSATVSLPWSQIDSIIWSMGDHLSCTHCIDPFLYGLLNEIITATVYAGGCIAEDQIAIRVDIDANIYVPNVFSPNGDFQNDNVTVWGDKRVKRIIYLEIFDRWGNQVFKANDILPNDPTLGWDGTFKNKPMNPAVFTYIAQVELINGVQIPAKGDITLLR